MKTFIFFILLFCSAIYCSGQSQGKIKIGHIKTSVFDTVSFDYITPVEYSQDTSKQNKVFIMKTSASDEDKHVLVNNSTTTDNSSKPVPTIVPKFSTGIEEEKSKSLPK